MEEIIKEWQSIVEGIRAVTDKTEKIVEGMGIIEKREAAKKSEAATEVPAKRGAQKAGDVTVSDAVLHLIRENTKGVDVSELKKRTAFNEKEIRRAIYDLRKAGRVKRVFVTNDYS